MKNISPLPAIHCLQMKYKESHIIAKKKNKKQPRITQLKLNDQVELEVK